jgi:hypothetical protein
VPSAEGTDPPRLVLDESSFNFRGMSDPEIEAALDTFNNNLQNLRAQGNSHHIACPPMWDGVECLDGCQLYQYLSREHASTVDRDTLLLTYSLLSHCPEWTPSPDIETSVRINGGAPVLALSVAYALGNALARRGTACMVFRDTGRLGFRTASSKRGPAEIFFFTSPATLPRFWRHLYTLEDVAEHEFFTLSTLAFPQLVLHPDLSFRHFDGAYRELRDRVVTVLSVVCDHFAHEYLQCQGLPHKIEAAMGAHHVDLSPESPKTRGSAILMRLREKEYGGHRFSCEWHAKLDAHRNRIHFAVPTAEIGGKILIGIFVDHLAT